jgi:hypothetical protein
MSVHRKKLIVAAVLVAVGLLLWLPGYMHQSAVQAIVDQSHRDATAATDAADGAAESAARAKASAQDAQNRVPGSS